MTGALGGGRGSGGGGQLWRGPSSLSVAVTDMLAFLPSNVLRRGMEAVERPAADARLLRRRGQGPGSEAPPPRDSPAHGGSLCARLSCVAPGAAVQQRGRRGTRLPSSPSFPWTHGVCVQCAGDALWGRGVRFPEHT